MKSQGKGQTMKKLQNIGDGNGLSQAFYFLEIIGIGVDAFSLTVSKQKPMKTCISVLRDFIDDSTSLTFLCILRNIVRRFTAFHS